MAEGEQPPPEQGGGGEEDLDFTTSDTPPPNKLERPPEKPFDPEPQRERMRGRMASGLLLLVAGLAVFSYGARSANWITHEDSQDLQPILAALITLTGTAIGFYFGGGGRR